MVIRPEFPVNAVEFSLLGSFLLWLRDLRKLHSILLAMLAFAWRQIITGICTVPDSQPVQLSRPYFSQPWVVVFKWLLSSSSVEEAVETLLRGTPLHNLDLLES